MRQKWEQLGKQTVLTLQYFFFQRSENCTIILTSVLRCSASERIQLIPIVFSPTAPTKPTPFILTEWACHMIAALVPLDFSLTHRTEFYGLLLTKFVHQGLFTRSPSTMPVVSALEANCISAFRANQLSYLQIICKHHSFTRIAGAVPNKRVAFLQQLILEHVQFCDNFGAVLQNYKDLLLCSFTWTPLLDTQ